MKLKLLGAVALTLGTGALLTACTLGVDMEPGTKSGTFYTAPETIAMQDDAFDNPASLWVDTASDNWSKVEGKAGKSCAECHGVVDTDASIGKGRFEITPVIKSMRGVSVKYPRYDKKSKKPMTMQDQINSCRTEQMKAKAWKWESGQMLGMTMLVKMQSRGMPIVSTANSPKDKLYPFWKEGQAFYNKRRGMMDMACSNCHSDYPGMMIRANRLSQGQINGFPAFRLKWQKPGSLHRRFAGCNKNIRAKHFGRGTDEYTNLEVFLMWKGRGLQVETPAVRM